MVNPAIVDARRQILAARLVLAVFAAVCIAWLAQLDHRAKISTNVLDLLPAAEQSPEVALVRHLASNAQSRVMLFALHDPSSPAAPPADATRAFINALTRSNLFAEIAQPGNESARDALGRAIYENRFRLLFPTWLGERLRDFESTGQPPPEFSAWLAERTAAELETFLARPEALAMETLTLSDPLLLVPGFIDRAGELAATAPGSEKHALIWARLHASPLAEEGQRPVFAVIDHALADARALHPTLTLDWTGVNRFAAASRDRIEHEVAWLNAGSLVAVLLVGVSFVRRPWKILHLAPVIILSLLGAWTISTLVFDRVHVLVLVIGALLSGVAIDYGFYIFMQPPAYPGEPYNAKLRRLIKPLLASCLTTVIGFSLLTTSDLPLLRQVGLFVGVGLLCALGAATLYFAQLKSPFLEARPFSASHPRRSLSPRLAQLLLVLAAIVLLVGSLRVQWHDDIRELEVPAPRLRENDRAVRTLFGDTPNRTAFITHGSTLAEARDHLDAFIAHRRTVAPDTAAMSLGLLYPTFNDWSALPERLHTLDRFAAAFRTALADHGFNPDSFAPFFREWTRLRSIPPSNDYESLYRDLAPFLTGPLAQLQGTGGGALAWFLTLVDTPRASSPPSEFHTVAVNQLESLNTLFERHRTSALRLSLIGLALVIASVFVIYRGRTAVRVAVIPLGASLLVLGTFGLLGQPLNLFHLLGVFLGLCLSHNYAIFSAASAQHRQPPPTSIRLSAFTTAASFGVLALSRIPVIHALGLTVAAIVLVSLAVVEIESRVHPSPR